MKRSLRYLAGSSEFEVGVIVTAQHTVERYGATSQDIVDSDLRIIAEIPTALAGESGFEMVEAMSDELSGLARFWRDTPPDLVLLLGDRGEMLAGALAAVHLGIHVGHIGGGEKSGTLDESFRHAISKLSHFHFPTTQQACDRLIRMGEKPEDIHWIGAPGLVEINNSRDRDWLLKKFGLSPDLPVALVIYHPVVQESQFAGDQAAELIEAVRKSGFAQIILRPNSDAGGAAIDATLDQYNEDDSLSLVTHLERDEYLRVMASVDLMVGNSSSGIIESASFRIPCVNVGSRQNGRERNKNTVDCADVSAPEIGNAVRVAMSLKLDGNNIYGDGQAHENLFNALKKIKLTKEKLCKENSY